jgi:hypothetical protein
MKPGEVVWVKATIREGYDERDSGIYVDVSAPALLEEGADMALANRNDVLLAEQVEKWRKFYEASQS